MTGQEHEYCDTSKMDRAVVAAAEEYADQHGAKLRETAEQPNPPYPSRDNPMLAYLLQGAQVLLKDGHDVMSVIAQATVHAWFEGNIEGREQAFE